ncbi:MAG TPA: hypothetical protein VHG28_15365 [Longimicrobiaceae bacterium]|nr:hypothetical protein [Longimicrobiaceae bacterium]
MSRLISNPEPGKEVSPGLPGESTASTFRQVVETEWVQIRRRRKVWGVEDSPGPDGPHRDDLPGDTPGLPPSDLVGLALSGGGIRSATFALGLLQEMSRLGVLKMFDYLSTVSGGGYAGGWWSAWLSRPDRAKGEIFPPAERCEPQRWPEETGEESVPHAPLSASSNDPIHHLRLFANYLTPRKGTLSADTWRAGTIVVRNLILTWLVLIPILLAAVLVGQFYFTMNPHPETNFLQDFRPGTAAPATAASAGSRAAPPTTVPAARGTLEEQSVPRGDHGAGAVREARLTVIRNRAVVAARPLVVLVSWTVLLTVIWMLYGTGGGRGQFAMTVFGTVAAVLIVWQLYRAVSEPPSGGWPLPRGWIYVGAIGAVALAAGYRLVPLPLLLSRRRSCRIGEVPMDLLRNRVVRVHSMVLVALTVLTVVLLIAGFSHDLVWYLFDPTSGGPLPTWIKQTGGWVVVSMTVGAMLFTGIQAAPRGGGGDTRSEPGLISRLVFTATPILALTLLAVLTAIAGRALIRIVGARGDMPPIDTALGIGVLLMLGLAIYEVFDRSARLSRTRRWLIPLIGLATGALVLASAPEIEELTLREIVLWVAGASLLLLVRWAGLWDMHSHTVGDHEEQAGRRHRWLVGSAATVAFTAFTWWLSLGPILGATGHIQLRDADWIELLRAPGGVEFEQVLLAGIFACGGFACAEHFLAKSGRWRVINLVTAAFIVLSARLVLPFLPLDTHAVTYSSAAVTLTTFSLVWVLGLGWMADPNMVSLHSFYKARLVRAYMGASNRERGSREITQSAVGDDVRLRVLKNCEQGAPYHLINTTLNLAGGRDLATAQRSADSFVLSADFCGSFRTGYRPTTGYMNGKMSLGTAVAVSGAAASPNMGSKTPSAALAMLLAFLNVRLAFWAPTPNKARWRDEQPRLWPFYLLRECLSQTDDLSAYCCLSDGGHFDNTGLYSLVARGCRYIVLSDCGADPKPCFEDMGNAIRRCRIDFGAEIDLCINKFLRSEAQPAGAHFVVGTITYSQAHVKALGWRSPEDPRGRRGVIVWIKPTLTATGEPADVRQYALENPVFPQQTTADQWFDEAQFESYRRLGEYSARQVFGGAVVPPRPTPGEVGSFFEGLRVREPGSKLQFDIDVVDLGGKKVLQVVEPPSTP